MKISSADIAHVAQLASLEVAETEIHALAAELSRIVEFFEQLNRLDTDAVEPTAQVLAAGSGAQREDRVESRHGSSEAADAVGLFRVPRVIGER